MGALVSFELARRLRRDGIPRPVHMIVSGHRAPQLPDPHQAIHELPDPEFRHRLHELNGTPEAVLHNPELMELLLPVLRADFAVCETYQYEAEEPLDCSISVFGGNNDARVSRAEIYAWKTQTCKAFSVADVSWRPFLCIDRAHTGSPDSRRGFETGSETPDPCLRLLLAN